MNQNHSFLNSSVARSLSLLLLVIYSLNPFQMIAQDAPSNSFYKVISHGEKIDFGKIEKGVSWILSSQDAGITDTYLNDEAINDYVFKKSGIYSIQFNDATFHATEECSHAAFPKSFVIKVSPVKMKFDTSKVTFSEPLSVGRDCEGITVSIPVLFDVENSATSTIAIPDFNVAGVGSNIVAKSIQKKVGCKNGIQILTYKLSGTVTSQSYLMFDFTDANNQAQTYNYNQLVK